PPPSLRQFLSFGNVYLYGHENGFFLFFSVAGVYATRLRLTISRGGASHHRISYLIPNALLRDCRSTFPRSRLESGLYPPQDQSSPCRPPVSWPCPAREYGTWAQIRPFAVLPQVRIAGCCWNRDMAKLSMYQRIHDSILQSGLRSKWLLHRAEPHGLRELMTAHTINGRRAPIRPLEVKQT
ncbi:hypothetical protein CH063_06588, partial [Colletotrichum higginsianum]